MSEHRPIPLPAGASLLERAGFDLGTFARAVPPLPEPPRVRATEPAMPVRGYVAPVTEQARAVRPFTGERYPIDREHLRAQGFIVPGDPVTGLLEEFRIVKRQLMLAAAASRASGGASHGERILVTSAHPGEGKTYCAVNLALSIAAEKDNEVLLVDADFAKPSVLSTLGLPGGRGLMDALADPALVIEDCVVGTDVPGLYVLPAGQSTHADTEFLAASRTAALFDRLSAQSSNQLIIMDSPPVLSASIATELAMHVGQALVIVRADRTSEAGLKDALSLLSGCADVKLLLNGAQFSPSGRRFGSYYGYGG